MSFYAKDGSVRVTLVSDGQPVSTEGGYGLYAKDGSWRVSVVGGAGVVITDGAEVTVGGNTYTFTVVDGEITDIQV
jgi:hypothetical protein